MLGRHQPPRTPVVSLLGLRFNALTEDGLVAAIFDAIAAHSGGRVLTVNLDILRQIERSEDVRDLATGAEFVVADGVPLVWASRLQGTPLPQTIPGSSLIYSLTAGAAARGASIFLLGGYPMRVPEVAAQRLRDRFPQLRVAGALSPPVGFEDDPAELRRIRDALGECRPDIVFVGLGFPKQERLIALLRPHLPSAWFLGVGIALSLAAGQQRRAPRSVQRLGLEWLYRLAHEPRRLSRRYLLEGLPFGARVFVRVLADRSKHLRSA